MLDFVSGIVSVHADHGWVMVSKRSDAKPFLKGLPRFADELEGHLRKREIELAHLAVDRYEKTVAKDKMISLSCDPSTVSVAPGTDIGRFIEQVTKRFTEIERIVEQAEEIGLRIKRRPYSEYIDEIANTGVCRVESFGFALFIDGKLIFRPDYRVALVRPTTAGNDTFEVQLLDPNAVHPFNSK
jgi:hypothetical protein